MWVVVVLTAAAAGVTDPPANPADVDAIVTRMEQAGQQNPSHYRPYSVTREYRLYGSDPAQPSAQVTARVEFTPPGTKNYAIVKAEGAGRGQGVVRHILDN